MQSNWKILPHMNITVVGDSTSLGFYNHVVQGIFRGQSITKHFKFIRNDISPWYPKTTEIVFEDIIIMNFGAHEAKMHRYECPVTTIDYLQRYKIHRDLVKNRLMPNETFQSASNKSMSYRTPACLAKCKRAADAVWRNWRDTFVHIQKHTNAIILFRSIQINFGFDRRGLENCIKIRLNNLLREHAKDGLYTFLDVTELVSTRQEEFVHENTNHFYCECRQKNSWCYACNRPYSVHQRFTEYLLNQTVIYANLSRNRIDATTQRL